MAETQPCPVCEQQVPVVDSIEQAPEVTGSAPPASATTLYTKCPRCETALERPISPGAAWSVGG